MVKSKFISYQNWWLTEISASSISLFRILIGLFIVVDSLWFLWKSQFIFADRAIFFRLPGTEWWPINGLEASRWVLMLMTVLGCWIAIGALTRISFILVALCYTHILLYDSSYFLNHVALMIVLTAVLSLIRTNQFYSIQLTSTRIDPQKDKKTILRYELGLIVGIILGAYFFGGLSKIRLDWLNGSTFKHIIVFTTYNELFRLWFFQPILLFIGTWTGLILDLFAPFFILNRITRPYYLIILGLFHTMNQWMFDIGFFSVLMICCFVLYFDPDWPEQIVRKAFQELGVDRKDWGTFLQRATSQKKFILSALRIILALGIFGLAQIIAQKFGKFSYLQTSFQINFTAILLLALALSSFLLFVGRLTRLTILTAGTSLLILISELVQM